MKSYWHPSLPGSGLIDAAKFAVAHKVQLDARHADLPQCIDNRADVMVGIHATDIKQHESSRQNTQDVAVAYLIKRTKQFVVNSQPNHLYALRRHAPSCNKHG